MSEGRLIVLSGPSGCGKGTMIEQILKDGGYMVSVSATTPCAAHRRDGRRELSFPLAGGV
jgi:guanylate kinase